MIRHILHEHACARTSFGIGETRFFYDFFDACSLEVQMYHQLLLSAYEAGESVPPFFTWVACDTLIPKLTSPNMELVSYNFFRSQKSTDMQGYSCYRSVARNFPCRAVAQVQ